jgi:hypothetical protein
MTSTMRDCSINILWQLFDIMVGVSPLISTPAVWVGWTLGDDIMECEIPPPLPS